MIVVADSSPLNYLILILAIEVLANLFGQILIPEAVFRQQGLSCKGGVVYIVGGWQRKEEP